jgi:hypothetical protein
MLHPGRSAEPGGVDRDRQAHQLLAVADPLPQVTVVGHDVAAAAL